MESPFFRSHWGYPHRRPHYAPSTREIHVQRQPNAPPSRVVNIPVCFVGSQRSKSDAALKIQKVLRGFLVRKSVRKIMAMRREVDELEKRLRQKEAEELIQSNPKEKLKVNETLMNLLFNLDSVRGFGSGVRDCRKTIIKKVIGLQEKVDAIVAGEKAVGVINSVPGDENDNSADIVISENIENNPADFVDSEQQRDEIAAEAEDNCDLTANRLNGDDNVESIQFSPHSKETKKEEVGGTCESPESHWSALLRNAETNSELKSSEGGESMKLSNTERIGEAVETMESERGSDLKSCEISDDLLDAEMYAERGQKCQGIGEAGDISDARTATGFISSKDVGNGDQTPSESEVEEDNVQMIEAGSQPDPSSYPENPVETGEEDVTSRRKLQAVVQSGNTEAEENNKRNKELLERMADENGRMIGLMAELFEKNEMQTRILESLSQRVEHLGKAIICEKLRKKKKKKKKRDAGSTWIVLKNVEK